MATEIGLTFGYADSSTRKVSLGPYTQTAAAVSGAKSNIMNFNSTGINNVKNLFLSDDGASCTGITAAEILTVTDREINLND